MSSSYYMWTDTFSGYELFCILLASILIDFIPTFFAFSRNHPSRGAIFLLNILFGWTGIGWVILMVWSLDNPRPHQPLAF